MANSSSKENILKKIRKALTQPVPLPFPQSEGNNSVYQPAADDLAVLFAQEFTRLLGKFAYCANAQELATELKKLVEQQAWKEVFCTEQSIRNSLNEHGFTQFSSAPISQCDVAFTSCEALVARTGSIMMSAAQPSGRTTSVYAPVHVCIANVNQLVYDVKDALQLIRQKYPNDLPSLITFATGPSRTADIEKTLVVGVHGPKAVYCFLVE
jgi:L-lactate dehydrogenase complex protein LldG